MITKKKKKTSHSYNQNQLKIICDQLCDHIEELLLVLGLEELKPNGKMIAGKCPIHDGDNTSAFNLYPDGMNYRGNWKCRTHNCEKHFKGSIIGFIRGVLSNKKHNWQKDGDDTVTFNETMDFIQSFLKTDIKDIKVDYVEIEKKKFANVVNNITLQPEGIINQKISRSQVRKSLKFPCDYFLNRGFSKEILERYDVGICEKENKEMFGRAVVPIYDNDYKFLVGCSGRSLHEKCDSCKTFHSTEDGCPTDSDKWKYSKWKHNYDFKSQNHLYNFWFAKKHILESNKVILVESPGNVWRLEEAGIHNSVGLFGSNLSDRQKIILDGSGAMTIILIMDNDDAGKKAAEVIRTKCKNTYNIIDIKINNSDVANMSLDEINLQIKRFI